MRLPTFKDHILCIVLLMFWMVILPQNSLAKEIDEDRCSSDFSIKVFNADVFKFPSSRDDINFSTHIVFAEFAAEQANVTVKQLKSDATVASIIDSIAVARQKLANVMNVTNSKDYGQRRTQLLGSSFAFTASTVPAENYLPLLLKYKLIDHMDYFADRFLTFYTSTKQIFDKEKNKVFFRQYEGSFVIAPEGKSKIGIRHPDIDMSDKIFSDVILRAEAFRGKNKELTAKNKIEFLRIAYGFFVAMPYKRGSGAIGRIFLESLYYEAFGHVARLPEDVDILALILNEESFLSVLILHLDRQIN